MVALMMRLYNCTDPTYKEWKQPVWMRSVYRKICTDPTYKEWKQFECSIIQCR